VRRAKKAISHSERARFRARLSPFQGPKEPISHPERAHFARQYAVYCIMIRAQTPYYQHFIQNPSKLAYLPNKHRVARKFIENKAPIFNISPTSVSLTTTTRTAVHTSKPITSRNRKQQSDCHLFHHHGTPATKPKCKKNKNLETIMQILI
jgi:hypothetical protein